jgi:hypothetical protein
VLRNPDTVLAQHLKIEERLAARNSPQVRETAERAMATFKCFKEWLAERQAANHEEDKMGRAGGYRHSKNGWRNRSGDK